MKKLEQTETRYSAMEIGISPDGLLYAQDLIDRHLPPEAAAEAIVDAAEAGVFTQQEAVRIAQLVHV